MTVRKVMLPKNQPKVHRELWQGETVLADYGHVDTKGQVSCRFVTGPDAGNAAWLNPLWLMEIERQPLGDVPTGGEW